MSHSYIMGGAQTEGVTEMPTDPVSEKCCLFKQNLHKNRIMRKASATFVLCLDPPQCTPTRGHPA